MTISTEKADDDFDAFDALESEEKEFIKVGKASSLQRPYRMLIILHY
jgi:hypothetical protein